MAYGDDFQDCLVCAADGFGRCICAHTVMPEVQARDRATIWIEDGWKTSRAGNDYTRDTPTQECATVFETDGGFKGVYLGRFTRLCKAWPDAAYELYDIVFRQESR